MIRGAILAERKTRLRRRGRTARSRQFARHVGNAAASDLENERPADERIEYAVLDALCEGVLIAWTGKGQGGQPGRRADPSPSIGRAARVRR